MSTPPAAHPVTGEVPDPAPATAPDPAPATDQASAPPGPFARLLRTFRSSAGLTQQQLADFATLSVRAIRDLEHGRAERPRRDTVRLLARALRLDPARTAEFEQAARGGPAVPRHHGPSHDPSHGYEYSTVLLDALASDARDGEWSRALNDMAGQAWRLVSVDRGVAFLERRLG
ncbi:helix-turn-helix domain-containing protein [Streptomyces sp. NPDC090025]|uniref:helix-turn-helix domain-containing protein n=1 Tax=Streptomyces sp. NPDC090025 TaxID=3365922 RepID=UPI003834F911